MLLFPPQDSFTIEALVTSSQASYTLCTTHSAHKLFTDF